MHTGVDWKTAPKNAVWWAVAAAVILPTRTSALARLGLKDSKQLTREQRELLDRKIRKLAIAIAIAEVDAETIDRVNIYQASRLAMLLAVQRLPVAPDHLLIDAMYIDLSQLAHPCAQTRLFYGDALSLSIAAASVVAKVHRDALMRDLDVLHPQYGLASHKGYATAEHRRALAQHGPCPLHRKTFAPVAAAHRPPTLTLNSGNLFLDDLAPTAALIPIQNVPITKSVISTGGAHLRRSGETRSSPPKAPPCL